MVEVFERSMAFDESGKKIDCALIEANSNRTKDLLRKSSEEIERKKQNLNIKLTEVESVVGDVLKNNIDLRQKNYRHFVRVIVEDRLKKNLSDETVPRAIRYVQNTLGLYAVKDDRFELEELHRERYSDD